MLRSEYENAIYDRLQDKPHLQPMFSGGCYNINERLREYDPALFVVWNSKYQRYEIHSLNHKGNTFACLVPNNRLDARVIREIRRGDLRIRGKEIFREMDEHNERLEKAIERQRRDELKAVAADMKSAFAKLAWEGL